VSSQFTEKPDAILSTALKLFVEYGFHGTPTSRIASEAGVSNGTLFHYFKTKDELIVALYVRIKDRLNGYLAKHQRPEDDLVTRFRHLFVDSVVWSLENRQEFYFIQQFHFSPHFALVPVDELERQSRQHTALLQEALQAKILKSLPKELIEVLISSQINGIHQYLLHADLSAGRRQKMIEAAFELTLNMILK
jgi:AcrR family transcriptional regulator